MRVMDYKEEKGSSGVIAAMKRCRAYVTDWGGDDRFAIEAKR